MLKLMKKDRALGVSNGRQYDLPLQSSPDGNGGNGFLILLIALMTFLAVLALMAGFALAQMTAHWTSGLQNQITIEIPAEDENGGIRSLNDINTLSREVESKIQDYSFIDSMEIYSEEKIQTLIAPWLGEDFALDDVPLPGLIALTLSGDADVKALEANVKGIDPTIRVDTHADWLDSVLSLIGSLQFFAALIITVIAVTGITAIAGAIRSRMAEHKPDVELLHLMGARDIYIAKQFQRHAMILGFKGGAAGVLTGVLMIGVFVLMRGNGGDGVLPDFAFNSVHLLVLCALPVVVAGLSSFTARSMTLRVLANMP